MQTKVMGKMDKRVKRKWLTALRSGKYKQARGRLKKLRKPSKSGVGHCCLGVLCDLYSKEKGVRWDKYLSRPGDFDSFICYDVLPPPQVVKWAGLDKDAGVVGNLAGKNDAGASFHKIADWIEENL